MTTTNWHGTVRNHQQQSESSQQELEQAWLDNFGEVASEVITNVLTAGWRDDLARRLVQDYYEEFHGIKVSGYWILEQLERRGYISYFKDDIAWGEKGYFVQVRKET